MTREEAIKEIREWDFINKDDMEVLATLIPELRESEDERIRKRIKGLIYHNDALLDKDELLAWLEKQKEQKPVDIDYISGIREELLSIENNAKDIDGLTESQWVAKYNSHASLLPPSG